MPDMIKALRDRDESVPQGFENLLPSIIRPGCASHEREAA
jgi:hypothetical protein